jgi:hypothetical protein
MVEHNELPDIFSTSKRKTQDIAEFEKKCFPYGFSLTLLRFGQCKLLILCELNNKRYPENS